ncbi:MAG: hemolysin family protein [Candidatus Cyclonatronum sp.]|uniref:hemolysin family protein n=1 Tax=Cyclonatronum sp. TaxID=3024185 RepID=UPI0025C3DDB1|nr:hemolysin family protein [Cyclonatronum sp.]MCH8485298.1 hemolysin family protein [Cyclonatronum sp.]
MEPPHLSLSDFSIAVAQTQAEAIGHLNTLDPVETGLQLLVIFLGLIFSAFFSGSEVAYFSQQNTTRFSDKEKRLDSQEMRVKRMLDEPRRLLATILIGNTTANIVTAVFAAVVTGKLIKAFALPAWLIFSAEILILTFTIVILTEITPKILALKNTYTISRRLSGLLLFFFLILSPLARIIAHSAAKLEARIPTQQDEISSEDIKTIAEVGERQGTLKGEEREIIENVIEFSNTQVKEIMTSRVNMVAVSTEATLDDVLALIREKSISRFPLFDGDLDTITGIIHAKDILPFLLSNQDSSVINWQTNARKALFVPTSKKIDDLLRDFQREKTHVAIVVDEYGGTEGLITLDDILEEIIGEIHDEHSETEELFARTENGDYIFEARVDLDDVAQVLDRELTTDNDEYETLGGLVYHLTERIPEEGEQIIFRGLELTVHETENNRLRKIRIHVLPDDYLDDASGEGSGAD